MSARDGTPTVRDWYERQYRERGANAQRAYPNEELVRFIRGWLAHEPDQHRGYRVLELGCGSGGNLWMLAREGLEAHGLDLSTEACAIARSVLQEWRQSACFVAGDMTRLPYASDTFDVVVDVFSAYCLDEQGFDRCLQEVTRVLSVGGRFFCFTPSKRSDAFQDPGGSPLVDPSTLAGITRADSPYSGNLYPFRFTTPDELDSLLGAHGLQLQSLEITGRTYNDRSEYFEFLVAVATRLP